MPQTWSFSWFCMTSACCLHNFVIRIILHIHKVESRVQIGDWRAPWTIFTQLALLIKPQGGPTENTSSVDLCNVALHHLSAWRRTTWQRPLQQLLHDITAVTRCTCHAVAIPSVLHVTIWRNKSTWTMHKELWGVPHEHLVYPFAGLLMLTHSSNKQQIYN
jgi:hypothetical protein